MLSGSVLVVRPVEGGRVCAAQKSGERRLGGDKPGRASEEGQNLVLEVGGSNTVLVYEGSKARRQV